MARVKIKFPDDKPLFKLSIPVRIGDINYGGHVGNDSFLSIVHEARVQLIANWGHKEIDIDGHALIMADVMIAYKAESFHGDILDIQIFADEVTDRSFDLLYHIKTIRNNIEIDILHAKTGMICFDYTARKIVPMGNELKRRLTRL